MSIARRIFSRRSILTLLVVFVGFIGAFGLPQKLGVTTDHLILALLAVTGLELLVQRVTQLEAIEVGIDDLAATVQPAATLDDVFLMRADPPTFETAIAGAQEVWVAGKSLNGLIASQGSNILSSGAKFRFLVHDPSISHIARSLATQSFSNPSTTHMERGLASGVEQLRRLTLHEPTLIAVRMSRALIPNGFTIVNPDTDNAWMRVELFSYKVSVGTRRSLLLSRQKEPRAFDFYLRQFSSLWKDATPLTEADGNKPVEPRLQTLTETDGAEEA